MMVFLSTCRKKDVRIRYLALAKLVCNYFFWSISYTYNHLLKNSLVKDHNLFN